MEIVKLENFDAMSKEQMKKVEGGKWGYEITSVITDGSNTICTWNRYNIFGRLKETGTSLNNDE